MIAYADASVILRIAFGEPGASWKREQVDGIVSSVLTEVECFRTLDRKYVLGLLTPEQLVLRHATVHRALGTLTFVEMSRRILRRASEGIATPLGSLDAIHLATALAWQEDHDQPVLMATHDAALSLAARAYGLEVIGA